MKRQPGISDAEWLAYQERAARRAADPSYAARVAARAAGGPTAAEQAEAAQALVAEALVKEAEALAEEAAKSLPVVEEEPVAEEEPEGEGTPNYDSMTKAELLEVAKRMGVTFPTKKLNREIIIAKLLSL